MSRFILFTTICFILSGCCIKVAEVERITEEDGTYTEEVTGFRYDCTGVLMVPGGKNIVKDECRMPLIQKQKEINITPPKGAKVPDLLKRNQTPLLLERSKE